MADALASEIEVARCSWCRRRQPVHCGLIIAHRNLAGGPCRGSGREGQPLEHVPEPVVVLLPSRRPARFEDDRLHGCHNRVTLALRRLGAGASLPAWEQVLRADPCSYCGARGTMTIDHIVPRSEGAAARAGVDNGTAACAECNNLKRSHSLLDFIAGGGMRRRPDAACSVAEAVVAALRSIGKLAASRKIAWAVRRTSYEVGMALAELRTANVVERVGQRWRLL